jgi:hypothetical protein
VLGRRTRASFEPRGTEGGETGEAGVRALLSTAFAAFAAFAAFSFDRLRELSPCSQPRGGFSLQAIQLV